MGRVKDLLNNPEATLGQLHQFLVTPQEAILTNGGSQDFADPETDEWYKPRAFHYDSEVTIEELQQARGRFGHYPANNMGSAIGVRKPYRLEFKFPELDPETGVTLEDPEVLGLFNRETNEIETEKAKELQEQWLEKVKEFDADPESGIMGMAKLRPKKGLKEQEISFQSPEQR